MSVDDLPTKEEILKKHITGYRGAVKQSDALKAMEEYAKQEAFKLAKALGYELAGNGDWIKKYCKTYWKERSLK
jgi:hypothetical protein